MNILLDECIPLPLKDFFLERGFDVEHVKETELAGMKNGELYRLAQQRCNIFISNDRHFRHPLLFPPTKTMGIIYLRISPNHSKYLIQGLERFLATNKLESIVAKKVVVRRNDFEIIK